MEKLVISVDYTDDTGKYWSDSRIKNKTIEVKDGETIHQAIGRAIEAGDYCKMSYKGKPQGNVYRDDKDGNSHIVGYMYRTKHFISDRSAGVERDNVPFDTWVTIHGELKSIELEDVEV